jgi:hypothetical protein
MTDERRGPWRVLGTRLAYANQVSNSVTDQIGHLFLAEELTEGEAQPDETEALWWRTVPLIAALRMAQRDELTDGFSLVGLYRAWHHLAADLE